MNPEQITQIIETIKTLNLNIDSNSAVQIVETVKPILWFMLIKELVLSIIGWGAFVLAVWLISRAVMSYWKKKSEE